MFSPLAPEDLLVPAALGMRVGAWYQVLLATVQVVYLYVPRVYPTEASHNEGGTTPFAPSLTTECPEYGFTFAVAK